MYLAHELKLTRRDLLARMDSRELSYWVAYFRVQSERPEKPPENQDALVNRLKNAFMIKKKGS